MIERKKRYKPEARKAQIIEVTKDLIFKNGLAWASVIRISETLGTSQATLYYHFKNRREILLATFESVLEDVGKSLLVDVENAWDFILGSAQTLYEQTIDNPRQARLFFEFLCAPPTENMREEVQKQISGIVRIFEKALRRGIMQGLFLEDIDVKLVAWEILSLGLTVNISSMLEMPDFISMDQAMRAVIGILESIKKPA